MIYPLPFPVSICLTLSAKMRSSTRRPRLRLPKRWTRSEWNISRLAKYTFVEAQFGAPKHCLSELPCSHCKHITDLEKYNSSHLLHPQSSPVRTAKSSAIWALRPKSSLTLGVVSNQLPTVLYQKLRTGINAVTDMEDARIAVETGVDGLDIVIGTSPQLMQHSHGKSMDYIRDTALEVNRSTQSLRGSLKWLADMTRATGDPIRQVQGLRVQVFVRRFIQVRSSRFTQHLLNCFQGWCWTSWYRRHDWLC